MHTMDAPPITTTAAASGLLATGGERRISTPRPPRKPNLRLEGNHSPPSVFQQLFLPAAAATEPPPPHYHVQKAEMLSPPLSPFDASLAGSESKLSQTTLSRTFSSPEL